MAVDFIVKPNSVGSLKIRIMRADVKEKILKPFGLKQLKSSL